MKLRLPLAALLAAPLPLLAQDTPPTDAQETPPAEAPKEDALVVTVNGHEVHESDVEARFQQWVAQRSGGRPVPEEQLAAVRPQVREGLVESLIDEQLLDDDVATAKVEASEAECRRYLENTLLLQLYENGMERADYDERIQEAEGISLDEFLDRQAKLPEFHQVILHLHRLQNLFPDECKVTDEEVAKRYQRLKSESGEVEARHILIGVEASDTEEQKAAKRAQAEELLGKTRAEGADFGEIAKEHSSCPSAPQGGMLGYFPREGAMVEPFAAAAFALEVGGISEVVETQFGYHIIMVTGRRGQIDKPLTEMAPLVRDELTFEKMEPLRRRHLEDLRKSATIEYAPEPEGEKV